MKLNNKEWYRGGQWSRGFTLVELLVVIAIIGILATLVLLQLGTARSRARDTQRISQINQIRTALEQYYEDNLGNYPDTTSGLDALSPNYIQRTPGDPLTGDAYGYALDDVTDSYHIYACLENSAAAINSDADLDSSAGWAGAGVDLGPATTETCDSFDSMFGTGCNCYYDTGVDNN